QVVKAEAVLVAVVQFLQHLGVVNERLGGDAAPVQADAAEALAFHDRRLQPKLRRANGSHVAAGSAAYNHYIILISVIGHFSFSLTFDLILRKRSESALFSIAQVPCDQLSQFSSFALTAARNLSACAPSSTRWSKV